MPVHKHRHNANHNQLTQELVMAKNSLGDPPGTVNLSTMQIRFATNENEQQHLTACGYRPLQPMIKPPLPSPTLTPQQRRCLQLLL